VQAASEPLGPFAWDPTVDGYAERAGGVFVKFCDQVRGGLSDKYSSTVGSPSKGPEVSLPPKACLYSSRCCQGDLSGFRSFLIDVNHTCFHLLTLNIILICSTN
jgi:hypothetical protein